MAETSTGRAMCTEETTRITQLEAELERVQRCAVCGTGQLHRRLTDDEALVAQRIYDADAVADRALAEVERLREDIATGPDWGEQYLREMDERKRQGDRAHKWQTRAGELEAENERYRRANVRLRRDNATYDRLVKDIANYALTPAPVLRSIEQAFLAIAERARETAPGTDEKDRPGCGA